jgi:hypothetical protein
MSRHVAPHRLADLAAGRLEGRDAARVRVHLDGCEACRSSWDRVRAARGAFAEIAGAPPPDLKWDRMRAQVYWTVGSGSFPAVAAPRARWPWLAVPMIAATAVAVAVWSPWQSSSTRPAPLAAPAAPVAPDTADVVAPAPIPVELAPTPLLAVITLIEGDASLVRGPGAAELVDADAIGAAAVAAGARISTADGRVALQLGAESVVTLGRRSSLALGRLDEGGVELVVDGQVDIEVTRRAPGQRFTVLAGGRTVEVRGTAFRVIHRDGEVAVSCEHGRVAVSSGDATVEIGAGQELSLGDADPLLGRAPRPLGDADLAALQASRVASLPGWTDPTTVLRTTRPFAVVAPRSRAVRVDGEIVGSGAIWMRVAPGRHMVEAETAPDRFAKGEWFTVGDAPAKPIVLAQARKDPAAGTASGRSARKNELERAIDRGRVRACVRKIESQGLLADTFVELEIGVDGNGAIRFLNIAETDLPSGAASCIRDTISASRLGSGAAATWRHRISF